MGESLLTNSPSLLEQVAETVGTPAYVYDAQAIRDQWHALATALEGVQHRVHYSVKANSNLTVLRLLRSLGAGVDIVSRGELARVQIAGFAGEEIVFSGVGKTHEELRLAGEAHVGLINLESDVEFDALAEVVRHAAKPVDVGIRVNPNVTTDTHPYTQTGHSGLKFGVPLDQVEELATRIAGTDGITLRGIGMHLGSQIADPSRYDEGIGRLVELVGKLRERGIDTLRSVDVGGGFAVSYGVRPALDLKGLASALSVVGRETGLEVLMEPGRYLTANAGFLLTRVTYRKASGGRSFVIVDAGMNDFIRPSFYQAYHEIAVVSRGKIHGDMERGVVDVVGPICESSDFQALERELPPVGPGGLLAICGAGAYGFSMSSTYNSRPRSAEVLVDSGGFTVIREREAMEQLWAGEQLDIESDQFTDDGLRKWRKEIV